MIGCQRIPLTEVRDIFIFPHLFMSVHYTLSYQYFQFMYITCIYLSYHCLGWYTVRIWVFVCVCCAAPDKLTSAPPFTGLGALQNQTLNQFLQNAKSNKFGTKSNPKP